jgi:hypothetical protein
MLIYRPVLIWAKPIGSTGIGHAHALLILKRPMLPVQNAEKRNSTPITYCRVHINTSLRLSVGAYLGATA